MPPGHVLVMDCRGDARAASAGDIYVTRLQARGVAGLVSDGGIRDNRMIQSMQLPVFCAGPSAPTNRVLHHAIDHGLPIACGGVVVYPGDIMVGDADGVCVIPACWWTRLPGMRRSRRSSKPSFNNASRAERRCLGSIPLASRPATNTVIGKRRRAAARGRTEAGSLPKAQQQTNEGTP